MKAVGKLIAGSDSIVKVEFELTLEEARAIASGESLAWPMNMVVEAVKDMLSSSLKQADGTYSKSGYDRVEEVGGR